MKVEFLPQMALAYRLVAISQGPKNSGIPGPNTFQLPHIMYRVRAVLTPVF